MRPAAFIDFQGTLGGEGTGNIKSFKFYTFSIEAIKMLNSHNILDIGITNQSHISKGIITMDDYNEKLKELEDELALKDAYFNAVYCCPHSHADGCQCKKPLTGMVDTAMKDYEIDIKHSYVIGDMGMTDMILAKNIGAKGILVLTGVGKGSLNEYRHTWCETEAAFIAENILDAVKWLIEDLKSQENNEICLLR